MVLMLKMFSGRDVLSQLPMQNNICLREQQKMNTRGP